MQSFFQSGPSYYLPPDAAVPGEPVIGRTDDTDNYIEEVLQKRFSRHLHVLLPRRPAPAPAPAPAPYVAPPAPAPAPIVQPVEPVEVVVAKPVEFRIPDAPKNNLSIIGECIPGTTLKAAGWYVETDPSGCRYQWYARQQNEAGYSPIVGATNRDFTLQPSHAAGVVQVECIHGTETQRAETANIKKSPLVVRPDGDLIDLQVSGGPYYTQEIEVVPIFSGIKKYNGTYQWFRSNNDDTGFRALPGANSNKYVPTCDDLHADLRCEFTVVKDDGTQGQTARADVPAHFLAVDPKIGSTVESNIKQGSAIFDVTQVNADGTNEPRQIVVDRTSLRIKQGTKTKSKVDHTANVRTMLSATDPRAFTLTLDPKTSLLLLTSDLRQRDVIALTLRSFVGMKVLSQDKLRIHQTASLKERVERSKQEAEQNLVSQTGTGHTAPITMQPVY